MKKASKKKPNTKKPETPPIRIPTGGKRIQNERRRIRDVLNNEEFQQRAHAIKKAVQIDVTGRPVITAKIHNQTLELAKDFHLSFDVGAPLWDLIVNGEADKASFRFVDKGIINHLFAHLTMAVAPSSFQTTVTPTIIQLDSEESPPQQENIEEAYPIVIAFRADTSQREMCQFIAQNWSIIERIKKFEKGESPQRRLRLTEERDQLIWATRHLPAPKSLKKVKGDFPDQQTSLSTIYSVRYRMKKRSQKI